MEERDQVQMAGNEEAESKVPETMVVRDNTGRKKRLLILLGAVVILLAAVIIGTSVFGDNGEKLQEQLDLGAKYLEEMDYEQALVAFNAALAIEPKNVDAYLGIVEVYIRTNEFELALETAKEGYEVTGDERLKERIDMIESGDIFASNGWTMKMSGYDGEGNLVYWHEFTYNLKGEKASVAKYNAQGVQEQYLELTYDEEGRKLVSYSYDTGNGNLIKTIKEYDGNNYRETHYIGTSDGIEFYEDVEVDSEGRKLKTTSYGKDGGVQEIEVDEYDGEGKLIKRIYYDSDNRLKYYYIHTYNEEGRRLRQESYDSDGVLKNYVEDVYDEEGNHIGSRHYDADGTLRSETVSQ